MKGINLRSLKGQITRVNPIHKGNPIKEIAGVEEKLAFCKSYLDTRFKGKKFEEYFHELPRPLLRNFSFDELCKMEYEYTYMHETIRKVLQSNVQHVIVHKIASSMFRWGSGKGSWNDVVDAYSKIKVFSFPQHKDFEIRIDLTTGNNERGFSRYTRTFLDGVFAILVYYKREHVMTIGFSFMNGRKILIQQIQLRKQSGNRWLYKLPSNRTEFVIELFKRNFQGYTLFMVDGKTIAQYTLAMYQSGFDRNKRSIEEYEKLLERKLIPKDSEDSYKRHYERDKEDLEYFRQKIEHLHADTERLAELYRNTGKFMLGKPIQLHALTHYKVVQKTNRLLKQVA